MHNYPHYSPPQPVTPGMRASAKLGELFERIYNEFLKLDVEDETLDILEEVVFGEKLEPIVREAKRAQKIAPR